MVLSPQMLDCVRTAQDRPSYSVTIDSPSPNILKAVIGYVPEDEVEYVGMDYVRLTNGSVIRVQ